MNRSRLLPVALLIALAIGLVAAVPLAGPRMIDDFESVQPDALPSHWQMFHGRKLVDIQPEFMNERERFYTVREKGNTFLRVYTEGEAMAMALANGNGPLDWDLGTHPRLAWDWRAVQLPPGAREDQERLNDSAAGLYVVFDFEGVLIKRPKAIKYVYSSTLPVGTVADYGKLMVIVASSGLDGQGAWKGVERDVVADYQRVFGGEPTRRPLAIRLWGDSDNTGSVAIADFDNIRVLPAR